MYIDLYTGVKFYLFYDICNKYKHIQECVREI